MARSKAGTRARKRWRRIAIVLALIVTVYSILIWIASSMFMHVRGFFPRHDEDTAGLTEITATTDDGLTLRGSFVEPPDPHGVLILFHGIGSERYRSSLPSVAAWGLIAVSFDFRGHGSSDGDVTTFGWEERRDVAAIVSLVRDRWPDKKVAAWGISLGGAALCYADVTRDLDAVVLESVYRDIDSAFEKRVTSRAPSWTVPFALPAKWLVSARLRMDPALLRPVDHIRRLRPERVLLTTGEKDPWAGPDDLCALAAEAPNCATAIVQGAVHHDVWVVGGEAYAARVRAFIDARLQ
jgi:pimeloyl-ACP methyl ester carboxylesterase